MCSMSVWVGISCDVLAHLSQMKSGGALPSVPTALRRGDVQCVAVLTLKRGRLTYLLPTGGEAVTPGLSTALPTAMMSALLTCNSDARIMCMLASASLRLHFYDYDTHWHTHTHAHI